MSKIFFGSAVRGCRERVEGREIELPLSGLFLSLRGCCRCSFWRVGTRAFEGLRGSCGRLIRT